MSVKRLFENNKQAVTVGKYLKATSPSNVGDGIESKEHLAAALEKKNYFLPALDYSDPANFARFGSAEEYYKNAFLYISNYYPYDGSNLERAAFYNKVNPLEKYILEDLYPRSTGYVTIGATYGAISSNVSGYYSSSAEYIQAKGGPHSGSFYNEDENRTSNLEFGGTKGTTVEFFLKKDQLINSSTESEKQVIFDLWNGTATPTEDNYGRLRIELVSGSEDRFTVTMRSGSNGYTSIDVPTAGGLSISDGIWKNYAFVFNTSGSSPTIDFFVNGTCIETGIAGATDDIGLVTGSMIANLGALRTDTEDLLGAQSGYGKLSASLDEFRFWKSNRDDEEIGRYWFDNVGGGSNLYDANVDLGVYFKFNEGITGEITVDQVHLDYSGRLSNGLHVGYTSDARSTGSAINSLELRSVKEIGDPILRTKNQLWISKYDEFILSGSAHDNQNSSRLLNHLPNWIIEEDENTSSELVSITQIISSYFDTLYNQLTALKKLRHVEYIEGDLTSSINEFPYNDRLVESVGFEVPEFFANMGTLQQFMKRDEQINFDQRLVEIKNSIYKNIYNNISFILKSKGNEKSIRNFIRCLGVSEEIIALNTYPDNSDYELKSNYLSTTSTKKFADFTTLLNQMDKEATVYQYPDASNSNSKGFLTGSSALDEFAFTLQSEVVFPNKDNPELLDYHMPRVLTSSVMGFHTPLDTDQSSTDLTWESAVNDHGLQVFAIRKPGEFPEVYSPDYLVKDAYFIVKDRAGTTLLTSPIYHNVYDNQKWNFSLSVRPDKYPFSEGVTGTAVAGYTLEFNGVNHDTGIKRNSFSLSKSYNVADGAAILESNKRIYVGAHRTNHTGSVIEDTDIRASSVRFWSDYIPASLLELHSKEADGHGKVRPLRDAFSFQNAAPGVYVPAIQTLAMNWDFANVTGSDASGRFTVSDYSSGSIATDYESQYQGQKFSDINLRQHTGRGDFFANSFTPVRKEYIYTDKLQVPEYVGGDEMVRALNADENTFGIYTRPENFFFAVEKSMYRSISNRMLEMFASIEDFNNLIGEPVNKYRMNYKRMEKIREIFFRRVQNDIPDLEKYIDYYKWLDTSMSQVIEQFFPESSRHAKDVRKVIENHVLERPKVQHRISILKTTFNLPPTGGPALSLCPSSPGWAKGHAPVAGAEDDNCYWWRTRAERNNPSFSTPAGLLPTRNAILGAIQRDLSSKTTVCLSTELKTPFYGGINQTWNKKRRLRDLTFGNFEALPDCNDEEVPNQKRKVAFTVTKDGNSYKGDHLSPITAISSSITTGYNAGLISSGIVGVSLTNLHEDSVLPYRHSVPMQGPFASTHVGGIQARHNPAFRTVDRAEEYSLSIVAGTGTITTLTTENQPKGQYLRGLASKSPVNISNIKTTITGHSSTSGVRQIGNYSKHYEVVQGNDRSATNMDFVFNTANYAHVQPSAFITTPARRTLGATGSADFAAPRQVPSRRTNETIIVDRFSAPGSKADSKQQFRDVNSDQFSANNALPFRNIAVRLPHLSNLATHASFGGLVGATSIASQHKTQRNGVLRLEKDSSSLVAALTASNYDDALVTRPIPSADRSQWTHYITGPENQTIYSDYISLGSRYPENISFVKQQLAAAPASFDAAIVTTLDSSKQFKWADNRSFVPWKQIRNGENPYAKYYTKNNTYEIMPQVVSSTISGTDIEQTGYADGSAGTLATISRQVSDRAGNTSNYYYSLSLREPPVTSRYKPLLHQIRTPYGSPSKTLGDKIVVGMKYSYGNDLMGFANRELNHHIKGRAKYSHAQIKRPYEIMRDQITSDTARTINGIDLIKVFSYPETIYPKEVYTYLSGSRARLSYTNDYWKNDSIVTAFDPLVFTTYSDLNESTNKTKYNRQMPRVSTPFITSQGYTVQASEQTPFNALDPAAQIATGNGSGSIWPLDSYTYTDHATSLATVLTASTPILLADAATLPAGELMMTHYGTIDDGITNVIYADGTASFQTSDINSAQYVYNIPVSKISTYTVPAVAATAQLEALSSSEVDLDGMTIIITTTTIPAGVTFTFDKSTPTPSGAGAAYVIGVQTVSTANDVMARIYISILSAAVAGDIDITPSVPDPTGEIIALLANVAGTAMNSHTITGTATTGGAGPVLVDPTNWSGGVDSILASTGELPEPRSPGYTYSRPSWTAGSERRYVDGISRGTLATAVYPFYDTYEGFIEDARLAGKDHTIIPEYRISEHVGEIERNGTVFSVISSSLEITGASSNIFDGTNVSFYDRFAQTDDIEFLEDFMPQNVNSRDLIFNKYPRHFEIESEAIVKLLPYNGFYPVDRTLDLASLFRTSYNPQAVYTGTDAAENQAWRSILRPFYAPGILYNSIKSGIAVDYPIRRSGRNNTQYNTVSVSDPDPLKGCLSGTLDVATTPAGQIPGGKRRNSSLDWDNTDVDKFFWSERLPFEAIMDPASVLIHGELQPTVLSDINSIMRVDVSGSLTPKGTDDSLYKKAVSNFLANVPKFFLREKKNKYGSDGYLTKFVSRFGQPAQKAGESTDPVRKVTVSKESAYMMEIGLMKTDDFNFYSNPYAYGIPTSTGSVGWDSLTSAEIPKQVDWPRHRGEFAPYTPPHYYGPSLVRITFMPNGDKDEYTLDEILNNNRNEVFVQYLNASSSYYDFTSGSFVDRDNNTVTTTASPSYGWNRAWQNRMDIDASVNVTNEFPTGTGGKYKSMDPNKWVIMPKWECPTLDYPDRTGPADMYAYSSSVNVGEFTSSAQGMWHQYGVMPKKDQGSYLYIKDIPSKEEEYDLVAIGAIPGSGGPAERTYTHVKKIPDFVIDSNKTVESLADLCGFDPSEIMRSGFDVTKAKRLGELAEDGEKTISEAILALPFYLDKDNNPRLITIQAPADKLGPKIKQFRKQFTKFSLPPTLANKLLGMVPSGYPHIPDVINPFGDDEYDAALTGEKMTETPVVYLMEHKVSITRQDLSDIWQGIMPELSTKFQKSLSAIDHYMPGDNVEDEPTSFPEVLKAQLEFDVARDGHPRYDLLDIAKDPDKLGLFPDIRWLIFKVKEKGIPAYHDMIMEEVDGLAALSYENIHASFISSGMSDSQASAVLRSRDNYAKTIYSHKHRLSDPTYNWPYDYCSILELGKISTKIGFRPELKKEVEEANAQPRFIVNNLQDVELDTRNSRLAGAGIFRQNR